MENQKKKKKNSVKLRIFLSEIGEKNTFWHWERAEIRPQNRVIKSLDERLHDAAFIWDFAVCQGTHLGVSSLQRV